MCQPVYKESPEFGPEGRGRGGERISDNDPKRYFRHNLDIYFGGSEVRSIIFVSWTNQTYCTITAYLS